MLRRAMAIMILTLIVGIGAMPTAAQEVKKSTLSGTLVGGSVIVPSGGLAVNVYTVPSKSVLVLTSFSAQDYYGPKCKSTSLPRVPSGTFDPGFPIPSGDVITCDGSSSDELVWFSGVLMKP